MAPTSLAAIANAALELARLDFVLMEWEPWCTARFLSDCRRCIGELEGLVVALSGNQFLAPLELMHAMDTLIALMAQADAAIRPGVPRRIATAFAPNSALRCTPC